jgi:hypothetical protein
VSFFYIVLADRRLRFFSNRPPSNSFVFVCFCLSFSFVAARHVRFVLLRHVHNFWKSASSSALRRVLHSTAYIISRAPAQSSNYSKPGQRYSKTFETNWLLLLFRDKTIPRMMITAMTPPKPPLCVVFVKVKVHDDRTSISSTI